MLSSPSLGHILIVDDDTNITELLSVNLKSEGYSVAVESSAANVDRGTQGETRLVIVDAMKQEYSGLDLVYDFRDDPRTEHIGIILYSPFKSERMVIDALDAGADDYIVKPFSLREIVARIKAVLRRHTSSGTTGGNILPSQGLTVDQTNQSVKIDGAPITLTKTEYAILLLLLKNQDNYITRAEMRSKIWTDDKAGSNERIVDTNISRLRKKLGDLGNRIVNRSGHGYMIS